MKQWYYLKIKGTNYYLTRDDEYGYFIFRPNKPEFTETDYHKVLFDKEDWEGFCSDIQLNTAIENATQDVIDKAKEEDWWTDEWEEDWGIKCKE